MSSGTSAPSGGIGADPEVMAAIDRGNAVVFFDVALGEGNNTAELGRIKIELFVKDVSTGPLLIFSMTSTNTHCLKGFSSKDTGISQNRYLRPPFLSSFASARL